MPKSILSNFSFSSVTFCLSHFVVVQELPYIYDFGKVSSSQPIRIFNNDTFNNPYFIYRKHSYHRTHRFNVIYKYEPILFVYFS